MYVRIHTVQQLIIHMQVQLVKRITFLIIQHVIIFKKWYQQQFLIIKFYLLYKLCLKKKHEIIILNMSSMVTTQASYFWDHIFTDQVYNGEAVNFLICLGICLGFHCEALKSGFAHLKVYCLSQVTCEWRIAKVTIAELWNHSL